MSDRATIKSFFETNDFPTQAEFADWLDSIPFFIDDEAEQLVITPVTSVQALAWNTTPIAIVPAQGALSVIKIDSIVCRIAVGGTVYTVAPGSRLQFNESALSGSTVAAMQNSFVPQSGNTIEAATLDAFYVVMLPNLPIVSAMTVGDPTLGTGTFSIHTSFKVVQF